MLAGFFHKMKPARKTVIVIAGPTAVGKTSTAIAIARAFNTEIISADSRQCYKEMNIGVATPSAAQLQTVPHHFIASHSISENVNAAVFEQYALNVLNKLLIHNPVAVVCGGTGLYIKALCDGFDPIPEVPSAITEQINTGYTQHGFTWLQQQVEKHDPQFFLQGDNKNPHRLLRALGVALATGKSIVDFQKGNKVQRDFDVIRIGLHLPKEILHQQIHQRVDAMIQNGLVEEVQSLVAFRHYKALQTVGYAEVFEFLDKKISLHEAILQIKTNTRQYAKRQLTWFRKFGPYNWYHPDAVDEIKEFVEKVLDK